MKLVSAHNLGSFVKTKQYMDIVIVAESLIPSLLIFQSYHGRVGSQVQELQIRFDVLLFGLEFVLVEHEITEKGFDCLFELFFLCQIESLIDL